MCALAGLRLRCWSDLVGVALVAPRFSFRPFDFDHDHVSPPKATRAGGRPCGSFCFAFFRSAVGFNFVAAACGFFLLFGGGIKSSHARPFPPLALRSLVTEYHAHVVSIRKRDPQRRHSTRDDDGE